MKFSYKVYRQGMDVLLAITDASLIGKTFEEGDITITVSDFYSGDECDGKKAVSLVRAATIINAVGPEIISLLTKEGFIDKSSVLLISGVPHAQIVSMIG